MAFNTSKDGTQIYYNDWGPRDAQPIVFHHGWPLSADDWDNQVMFFLDKGYRTIAFDRRGHGRSDQTDGGNEMDTYASDTNDLVEALDLKNAIHIGHSTGGGVVIRYVAQYGLGNGRVEQAQRAVGVIKTGRHSAVASSGSATPASVNPLARRTQLSQRPHGRPSGAGS